MAEQWFALQVRGSTEASTGLLLEQVGIPFYLPTLPSKRRWSDRVKLIAAPLFPGYLFAHFDYDKRHVINDIPHRISIVGIGQKAHPITESEIGTVRLMIESGLEVQAHNAILRVTDEVKIQFGAFAGRTGTIARINAQDRLVVNIPAMHRAVSVELDRDWLEKVPKVA